MTQTYTNGLINDTLSGFEVRCVSWPYGDYRHGRGYKSFIFDINDVPTLYRAMTEPKIQEWQEQHQHQAIAYITYDFATRETCIYDRFRQPVDNADDYSWLVDVYEVEGYLVLYRPDGPGSYLPTNGVRVTLASVATAIATIMQSELWVDGSFFEYFSCDSATRATT